MTVQIPGFMQIEWVKGLITLVFIQAIINAIFTFNPSILLAVLLAEAAILAAVYVALRIKGRQKAPMRGENTAFQHRRKGLIFTVGGQDETVRISLAQQKPELIGFICTDKTKDRGYQLLKELGIDAEHYKLEEVDPLSIHEIRIKVELILEWMARKGLQKEDIAVDITGGTKTMTIGAFSVSEENEIDSQYIFCREYLNNKCVNGTQVALLISDFEHK
jgi:hypothetical protein